MIRAVHLLPELDYGGVESLRVTLGRTLASASAPPLSVKFVALGEGGAAARELRALGQTVRLLRARPHPLDPVTTMRLIHCLRDERADVIHAAGLDANVQAAIAIRFSTKAVLVTEEIGIPRSRAPWMQRISALAHRSANRVVAASAAVARYMIDVEGVMPKSVSVIHNAASVESPPPGARAATRRALGLGQDSLVIGTVGRLVPEKAFHVLLSAFDRMMATHPGAHLVVVGDGPLRADLEAGAAMSGAAGRIHFLGHRSDVAALMKSFDVFVLPSISEALGIALIEAMLLGLPVIATATDGIVEVIRAEDEGILVPPNDVESLGRAMMVLAGNPVRRGELGARAAVVSRERFSPVPYVKKLCNVYAAALADADHSA